MSNSARGTDLIISCGASQVYFSRFSNKSAKRYAFVSLPTSKGGEVFQRHP